jgi:hypothetical protein
MQVYDSIDPYQKNPLKLITNKADSFLRRHANMSYKDFLEKSNPEEFVDNDYGSLPRGKNLKRRLFEHRTMFYLSALEDSEKKGHNLKKLLSEIRESTIPFIKKEKDEPTFREILKVLNR